MRRLAIIPARGGSKRIPRKNIRPFLGKPIIAYSIEAALQSELFDEVVVSTDDEEIAEVARAYGAAVPHLRSAESATDFATTVDVLREVHLKLVPPAEQACCIYATAPFVTSDLLREALRILEAANRDSVLPVQRFGFPIQRAVRVDGQNGITPFYPEYVQARSQDLEPAYHDCGMFYWYRPEPILAKGRLWTDNSGCIIVSERDAHDIDTEEDWAVAEMKYRQLHL